MVKVAGKDIHKSDFLNHSIGKTLTGNNCMNEFVNIIQIVDGEESNTENIGRRNSCIG